MIYLILHFSFPMLKIHSVCCTLVVPLMPVDVIQSSSHGFSKTIQWLQSVAERMLVVLGGLNLMDSYSALELALWLSVRRSANVRWRWENTIFCRSPGYLPSENVSDPSFGAFSPLRIFVLRSIHGSPHESGISQGRSPAIQSAMNLLSVSLVVMYYLYLFMLNDVLFREWTRSQLMVLSRHLIDQLYRHPIPSCKSTSSFQLLEFFLINGGLLEWVPTDPETGSGAYFFSSIPIPFRLKPRSLSLLDRHRIASMWSSLWLQHSPPISLFIAALEAVAYILPWLMTSLILLIQIMPRASIVGRRWICWKYGHDVIVACRTVATCPYSTMFFLHLFLTQIPLLL